MAAGMPELGSRISLISKADIRYEGKLFTIDSNECTIALCNVRSYGTEDRETNFHVPAQSQVYDYILFRGSDIKDIKVLSTTIHHDPAIVQLSAPPTLNTGQYRIPQSDMGPMSVNFRPSISQMTPSVGHIQPPVGQMQPSVGHIQASVGQMQPSAGQMTPSVAQMSSSMSQSTSYQTQPTNNLMYASTMYGSGHYNNLTSNLSTQSNIPVGISKNSTPSTPGKDHKTVESGENHIASPLTEVKERVNVSNNKNAEQPERDEREEHLHKTEQDISPIHHTKFRSNQQERWNGNAQGQRAQSNHQSYNKRQSQTQHQSDTQYQHPSQSGYYNERNNRYGERNEFQDCYSVPRHLSHTPTKGGGNWNSSAPKMRGGRGNRNMAGMQNSGQSNFRQMANSGQSARRRNNAPLDEYDFEQANSQFEELRSQLAKVKLDDTPTSVGLGDSSSNETGFVDSEHEEDKVFYDKKRSFFDNISCEAIEKTKSQATRPDWKLQRKLNSETFGLTTLRRPMVSYRGRGGFHYQGRGGGGQSFRGYYGGYHHNNRYNNQVRRHPGAITRVDSTQTDNTETANHIAHNS